MNLDWVWDSFFKQRDDEIDADDMLWKSSGSAMKRGSEESFYCKKNKKDKKIRVSFLYII